MSLFAGIFFLGVSLLLMRVLQIWNDKYGPIGRFATEIMVNLLIPMISAALVTGAGIAIASVWAGISLRDAGAAALLATVFVLAWRRLGSIPGRSTVVPFTPKPGAAQAGLAVDARSRPKAA
ncbi:MAG: hypothetical protein LJE59_04195 [Chromatiaceae bacterium]|jgi:hypothetical protein|nr:hypothetical protein [Chromatiaceae bacterium]